MTQPSTFPPALRKFPYPYRNMLAILSDVDLMSKSAFEGMHRFLNTHADCGAMGRGVGLDVGDTFWMGSVSATDDGSLPCPDDHRSWRYWWTDTRREMYAQAMRRYITAGWIDAPHTFFDYRKSPTGYSHERASAVVEEWARIGFTPLAWVDHARNPWNIATFRRGALARDAGSGALELTVDARLGEPQRTASTGDTVVVGGQRIEIAGFGAARPGELTLLLARPLHDGAEARTPVSFHPARKPVEGAITGSSYRSLDLARQAGIRVFWSRLPHDIDQATDGGRLGMETTVVPQTMPDGAQVWGLMRYYEAGQTNNTWLGACLRRVLFGDALTHGQAMRPDTYVIVSTHLGYGDADGVCDSQYTIQRDVRLLNGGEWFNQQTVSALRALAAEQSAGRVLVASTTRLVRYNLAHQALSSHVGSRRGFEVVRTGGGERIVIHSLTDALSGESIPSLSEVRGMTFYCEDATKAEIWIRHRRLRASEVQVNPPDQTGRPSIGVQWYPVDRTDHTVD